MEEVLHLLVIASQYEGMIKIADLIFNRGLMTPELKSLFIAQFKLMTDILQGQLDNFPEFMRNDPTFSVIQEKITMGRNMLEMM